MDIRFDIIICTYDREEILLDCLSSLETQDGSYSNWKIIVVNNATEEFQTLTIQQLSNYKNLRILHEPVAGLSKARNLAVSQSDAGWVGFLDDDARVPSDYISKVYGLINDDRFDCFGGHIISWWRFGRPRWLAEDFGSKPIIRKNCGPIKEEYNWGSNIIIRRSALDQVGMFPADIGMKGDMIGYAAENIVQQRLREEGYIVGYDPDLKIEHVVMPHKLKLYWHLKSAYATGRDGRSVYSDQYGALGLVRSVKNCISRPLKAIYFLFVKKEYYWESAFLETAHPFYLLAGKIRALFSKS